jgi:enoyl-CoA hydratase/carnithine racemase
MNQKIIRIEHHNKVAIVKLDRNVTNALNLELVTKLDETLHKVKKDSNIHSLVLTSSNEKFFSIGFDIPQLFEFSKDDFQVFYKAFNRLCMNLYTFPKLTIAAITGHAVAGGCILVLCCDYRFIAEGKKKMGLNEIKLGVPIPYPVDCILRQIVGFRIAREIMDTGEFYESEKLLQMGMVDLILPLDQLLLKSIERAKMLGALSQDAFAMIKRNRVEMVEAQILTKLKEKEKLFLECWYSDETRKRLKGAMAKF